jgi:4'-phosphopantetheinyl transferase EntD
LGIDVELIGSVEAKLCPMFCMEEELRMLTACDDSERLVRQTLLFSAKEAAFKYLAHGREQGPDFREIRIEFVGRSFRASVPTQRGMQFTGRGGYVIVGGHVITGCSRSGPRRDHR